MTQPMIRIHNSQTGEITDREMNAEELAELAADKAAADLVKATEDKAATDKAALLNRLGITADEAKLLLS